MRNPLDYETPQPAAYPPSVSGVFFLVSCPGIFFAMAALIWHLPNTPAWLGEIFPLWFLLAIPLSGLGVAAGLRASEASKLNMAGFVGNLLLLACAAILAWHWRMHG